MISASAVVGKFAPNAKPAYISAFANGDRMLAEHGIVTPMRLAHFMAQCLHETGRFSILVESGRYSAANLGKMWDGGNWHRYFANRGACVAMAQQCAIDRGVALFSLVYGNRMGNGPKESGDGWTYRGRGILQTTGRESYRKFGKKCGVAFEDDPDLVVDPQHALKPALAEWSAKNLNAAADSNDIKVITYGINGGYVGLPDRKAWFAKILPFIVGSQPVEHSIEWRVQAALNATGFDCGTPDGVVGPQTRSQILAFRASRKLALVPAIAPDLLLALGLAPH